MPETAPNAAPMCVAADPRPLNPTFAVPAGGCDCHAHVFGSSSRLVPHRAYTPPDAGFDEYLHLLQILGLTRGVIVQPSVYGTDNRATLAAVEEGGPNFRAVVVVDEDIGSSELRKLHEQGARGARANALFQSNARLNDLQKLAHTLADVGWHLQLLVDVSNFEDLTQFVRKLPVPVVFDHFGHMPVQLGVNHPGFQAMLGLVSDGLAWVKLSGSYRITAQDHPPYSDVAPFAQALIRANPDQLVWASDWPHPQISRSMPNGGPLLDMLADWAPDKSLRSKILITNPAHLYGFEVPGSLE